MDDKELKFAREKYNILINTQKRDDALEMSFGKIAKQTKTPNNIFVFIGYYSSTNKYNVLSPISANNPYARYKYYVNIETLEIEMQEVKNSYKFEKENIVFYFDNAGVYSGEQFYWNCIKQLREEFFKNLITKSQEESIKQLIKKR